MGKFDRAAFEAAMQKEIEHGKDVVMKESGHCPNKLCVFIAGHDGFCSDQMVHGDGGWDAETFASVPTKEEVSGSHMALLRAKYLANPYPPEKRNALVVGTGDENIGDGIADTLEAAGMHTVCLREREMRAENLNHFRTLHRFDTIVFVNGRSHLDWIEDQPQEDVYSVIRDSLTASILGTKHFVNATLDTPFQKQIVYIGSMAYRSVLNASAPYCAAKAGLAMFARCMAWELAPKNYNVFTVHPSNTKGTPMTEETIQGLMRYRNLDRAGAEAYWSANPLRTEMLTKENIGDVVAFLVSGKADYLSGTQFELGGGQR